MPGEVRSSLHIVTIGLPSEQIADMREAVRELALVDARIEGHGNALSFEPSPGGRRADITIVAAHEASALQERHGRRKSRGLVDHSSSVLLAPAQSDIAARALRDWGYSHVFDPAEADIKSILRNAVIHCLQRSRAAQAQLVREALDTLRGFGGDNVVRDPLIMVDDLLRIRFANTAAQELPSTALSRLLRATIDSQWPPIAVIGFDLITRDAMDLSGSVVATQAQLGEERMTILRLRLADTEGVNGLLRDRLREIDPHTGLPNQTAFQRQATSMLAAADDRACCGILLINLRGLHQFIQSLEAGAGDGLLAMVVQRLRENLRIGDLLAQFDDDTFVALLTGHEDLPSLQAQALSLLGVLQQPLPLSTGAGDAGTAELTVHIGGSVWPDDSPVLATLIEHASIALRRALKRSRGDCEWFDMRRARNVLHRHDRVDQLRRAFEREEFGLVFQPEFDRTGGRVLGAEALLRWTDASGRCHAPRNFVPLLEEAGLIHTIGDHTLQTACTMAQSWQREEGASLQISVNLAPQQLIDRNFAKRVTNILDQTGFPAHRLELEIAEASFVRHAEEAARGLHELADLGVRLLLDDCGAGALSISCLKTLPLSGIKIDRSVIAGIERNHHDCALIKAMIDLAISLDLNVVGEGVESVMQALTLGAMGIGRMQGYLFAPGLPHEEFAERFLRPFETE